MDFISETYKKGVNYMSETKDFKKDKSLYLPKTEPSMIEVPNMTFVAIQGKGNPNEPDGEYQQALSILYGIQYAIKMSKKGSYTPKGYYNYVVPPLEGLWWLDTENHTQSEWLKDKSKYNWISMIRLPEYVNDDVFKWACNDVANKKKTDTGKKIKFS